MTFKTLREEMTEDAMAIEYALRSRDELTLNELTAVCNCAPERAEFTLEQMIHFGVATRKRAGRYSLTPAYLAYPVKAA
ncbi:hypothetical protein NGJ69_20905 [Atlantibacter hermannii]|uniref:hypothetical protein n=1 Tax=Atlantibacter hermannii TaxID=565 RepID=UPI002DBE0E3E|nr:hypothetical protein [Atlantibacter hermannii]MEB7926138.1 hypothetical protein [Atlantibacter hermannii]